MCSNPTSNDGYSGLMETQVTFSGSPSTGMSFLMIVPLMVSSTKTFPQSMKARSLIRFTSTWHPEGYSGDMESPETVIAKSTSRIGDNTFSQSYSITDAVKSFNDPPCADIGINGTMVADSSCSQDSPPKYLCGFKEGAQLSHNERNVVCFVVGIFFPRSQF